MEKKGLRRKRNMAIVITHIQRVMHWRVAKGKKTGLNNIILNRQTRSKMFPMYLGDGV